MRRINKGIATFALAGAVLTPAVAATTSADAHGALVNVYATNILTHNQVTVLQNVSIPVAAALCNINANVLSTQLQNNQRGNCPALTNSKQIAFVKYN